MNDFPIAKEQYITSESEDENEYKEGGYHRVNIGDKFNNGRYIAIRKLGWGHFSTVWLCANLKTGRPCAIKIQKADETYTDVAEDEVKILEALKGQYGEGLRFVVELIENFKHKGPNGVHICLVLEVLGKSLLSIKRYNYYGVPMHDVKSIARQILEGLEYCHEKRRIIHTDIKPENILFVCSEEERNQIQCEVSQFLLGFGSCDVCADTDKRKVLISPKGPRTPNSIVASRRIKIADFGNACWTFHQYADEIQTRQYRSPEVIIGADYNTKADIWSTACLLFELATGDFLFDPHGDKNYCCDEDHLAQIMELVGPMPLSFLAKGEFSEEFFDCRGLLRNVPSIHFSSLYDVLQNKYKMEQKTAKDFSEFLMPMLQCDPDNRISAQKARLHPFLG